MKTSVFLTALAVAGLSGITNFASAEDALDIPALLKGKLIAFEDGKIVEAELTGDPEYYVIYHSASW